MCWINISFFLLKLIFHHLHFPSYPNLNTLTVLILIQKFGLEWSGDGSWPIQSKSTLLINLGLVLSLFRKIFLNSLRYSSFPSLLWYLVISCKRTHATSALPGVVSSCPYICLHFSTQFLEGRDWVLLISTSPCIQPVMHKCLESIC